MNDKSPNIWQDWRQRQLAEEKIQTSKVHREVLRKHGMHPDHTQACRGCIHLRRTREFRDRMLVKGFACSAFGNEAKWQPDWPACAKYGKVVR